jgi:hypothetical protein
MLARGCGAGTSAGRTLTRGDTNGQEETIAGRRSHGGGTLEADEVRGAVHQTRDLEVNDSQGKIKASEVAASVIYADEISANTVVADAIELRRLSVARPQGD